MHVNDVAWLARQAREIGSTHTPTAEFALMFSTLSSWVVVIWEGIFFPSSTSDKNKFPKFASNWLSNWELPFEQNIMENSLFTSFSACHLSNKLPSKEDKSEKSHSHIQTHPKKRELIIEAWFIYFVTKCFIFFHPSMGLRMCVCVRTGISLS